MVVEPLEAEEKTAGGILLPDTAKQKPQRGKVLAVGPGKLNDNGNRTPWPCRSATTVLFGNYAATTSKSTARNSRSCARATSWRKS